MKTKQILISIFIITILGFFSLVFSTDTSEPATNNNVVFEDELILEDWMTEPFIIDTVNTQKNV